MSAVRTTMGLFLYFSVRKKRPVCLEVGADITAVMLK